MTLTYEYICNACEEFFIKEQSIKDDPETVCPNCLKEGSVQRLIASSGSFILKGNHWAKDGYGLKETKKK
jgi:putative FmdB family regulatory protein